MSEQFQNLKGEANKYFSSGDFTKSIEVYTKALETCTNESKENISVLYKNRAAAYLKKGDFAKAVADCDEAIKISSEDAKALFRKSQALEGLNKIDEAYEEMKKVCAIDKSNKEAQESARRLLIKKQKNVEEKIEKLKVSVTQVMDAVASYSDSTKKGSSVEAAKKLLQVSADPVYQREMLKEKLIGKMIQVVQDFSNAPQETVVALLKILISFSAKPERANEIYSSWSIPKMTSLCSASDETIRIHAINLAAEMASHVATSETKNEKPEEKSEPKFELPQSYYDNVPTFALQVFIGAIKSKSEEVQVNALNAIIRVLVNKQRGIAFMESPGFEVVLSICGTESRRLRSVIAVTLSKIFQVIMNPTKCSQTCSKILANHLDSTDSKKKYSGLVALSLLFQADVEVGSTIFSTEKLVDDWMETVEFDTDEVKMAMIEMFSAAGSDKGCRKTIAVKCVEWLLRMANSKNERVQIRAAVTLTKTMASSPEVRNELMKEIDLTKIILKAVSDKKLPMDVRQWGVEGLAYLSINASVKEEIIKSKSIIDTLVELSTQEDKPLQYGITSILSNVTMFLPKLTEEQEQLKKIHKFSGEYVPDTHPLDKDDAVEKRVDKLVSYGGINAIVSLSKTTSANIRESLSQTFLSITRDKKHRGMVVQQGGVPALLRLANEGTDKGKDLAAQSLAKIAITMDPNIAFKGERAAELVRPLVRLLKSEDGLQNFESLLALTNLATLSEEIRHRIVVEKGVREIEMLMFNDHQMIQRAATEAMCNLLYSEEVYKMFTDVENTERMRIFIGLSDSEDYETRRAASGGLALLSTDEKICQQIQKEKHGLDILMTLLGETDKVELQHRAVAILRNMSMHPDIAKWLIEKGMYEPIEILTFSQHADLKEAAKICCENLNKVK